MYDLRQAKLAAETPEQKKSRLRLAQEAKQKCRDAETAEQRAERTAKEIAYRNANPEPARKASRKWVAAHRELARAMTDAYRRTPIGKRKMAERTLMRQYGITVDQRENLFESQGRCCASCGSATTTGFGWHVEHDHKTKLVRGIACMRCNVGIGMLGDDVESVARALAYLTRRLPEARELALKILAEDPVGGG